jgi:hypothetical protein
MRHFLVGIQLSVGVLPRYQKLEKHSFDDTASRHQVAGRLPVSQKQIVSGRERPLLVDVSPVCRGPFVPSWAALPLLITMPLPLNP